MDPRATPISPVPQQHPATPAWTVYAWPTVLWQRRLRRKRHFRHLGTQVTVLGGDSAEPSAGQTVWGEPDGERVAGIAWDWVELAHGVVAIADPMTLVTNVLLLGPRRRVLTPLEAAPLLNDMVSALPWQNEVQRALERLGH